MCVFVCAHVCIHTHTFNMDGYHCITRLNFNLDLRSPFVLDFEDSPPKKNCPKLIVSPNCLFSRFYSIFLIILFRM